MEINNVLGFVGEKISLMTQKLINFISTFGVELTLNQAKVLNLLVFLILIYLFIKVIEVPKKMIKIAIILLLIFLIASVIFSLI